MALPLIKVVQLTLTNRCQLNCGHCGVAELRSVMPGELSLEQIDDVFRDLRLAGCLVVDLFGGEPTLRKDLFEIIRRGKASGFIMSLETNGWLLDGAFVRELEAAGLDQIYLSLDDYRPEEHDRRRGRAGSFERAVRALELGAASSIIVHVSIVPQTAEFFSGGHMNRFMAFVLEKGAGKVRLLLPRFSGRSARPDGSPFAARRERDLFACIAPEYAPHIYVHTPGTPVGETNKCTAKNIFCHIMSNGWIAPCPYLPLVFGDATRESVMEVFERMQSHPLVRLGGDTCPMRNPDYIEEHIRPMGPGRPFYPIASENQVDLGAPCPPDCRGCDPAGRPPRRPAEAVIRDLQAVDPNYRSIEFHGGDALLRTDLIGILGRVPPGLEISIWTTGRFVPEDPGFRQRLRSFPVRAIRVMMPLVGAGTPGGLGDALGRIRAAQGLGPPVHLYMPAGAPAKAHRVMADHAVRLGVERIYLFRRDPATPLPNAVACFGRVLGQSRLAWVRRDGSPFERD